MDDSVIAVKVYNGTFVPVLNTSNPIRRRLVLTTVKDGQTSVKIGLYKGSDETLSDAEYIGNLIIENITSGPKGEADITLLLGTDAAGNLNATATDAASGEYQCQGVTGKPADKTHFFFG